MEHDKSGVDRLQAGLLLRPRLSGGRAALKLSQPPSPSFSGRNNTKLFGFTCGVLVTRSSTPRCGVAHTAGCKPKTSASFRGFTASAPVAAARTHLAGNSEVSTESIQGEPTGNRRSPAPKATPNLSNRSGQHAPIRHCEELLRRSNPGAADARPLGCFASLAMTGWNLARLFLGVA